MRKEVFFMVNPNCVREGYFLDDFLNEWRYKIFLTSDSYLVIVRKFASFDAFSFSIPFIGDFNEFTDLLVLGFNSHLPADLKVEKVYIY